MKEKDKQKHEARMRAHRETLAVIAALARNENKPSFHDVQRMAKHLKLTLRSGRSYYYVEIDEDGFWDTYSIYTYRTTQMNAEQWAGHLYHARNELELRKNDFVYERALENGLTKAQIEGMFEANR